MKLNHVALTVTDRERSADFYGLYFGMNKRVHEDDHLLILESSDGSLLALSEGKVPKMPPRTTHFGFEADSKAAVTKLREKFAVDQIVEAEWQADSPIRVQVFDPDGYRVEAFAW
jgi:catechol 2,3-dioxygenase-like lactoylglutathione lyase family enzyme